MVMEEGRLSEKGGGRNTVYALGRKVGLLLCNCLPVVCFHMS